jgi:hypothetical protein
LLPTEYPPVIALGHDVRSGGIVEVMENPTCRMREKTRAGEKRPDAGVYELPATAELSAMQYCRGGMLIKESLGQILDARDIPNRFPSFWVRERTR